MLSLKSASLLQNTQIDLCTDGYIQCRANATTLVDYKFCWATSSQHNPEGGSTRAVPIVFSRERRDQRNHLERRCDSLLALKKPA
jgi:hypothetical protein